MDIEQTVLEKIKFQWKTLKKAFSDLNQERTGAIKPNELRSYLLRKGLYLTDEQFNKVFARFDQDGDGKISYEDFQRTAGSEINPTEHLYFRQDIIKPPKKTSCQHFNCWHNPAGFSDYCALHLKMFKEKALKILAHITEKIGNKWQEFITRVYQEVDKDDNNIMPYNKLLKIFDDFKVSITSK